MVPGGEGERACPPSRGDAPALPRDRTRAGRMQGRVWRWRGTGCTGSRSGVPEIRLVEGQGVEGDAHAGETVRHRSRVAVDPTRPNLRQVHLIQRELFEELAAQGLSVAAGEMGENITTAGLDLLALPEGTRLRIGPQAEVVVTGLRNPCGQIEAFRPGLLRQFWDGMPGGRWCARPGSWRWLPGVALCGRATGSRSCCRPRRTGRWCRSDPRNGGTAAGRPSGAGHPPPLRRGAAPAVWSRQALSDAS